MPAGGGRSGKPENPVRWILKMAEREGFGHLTGFWNL